MYDPELSGDFMKAQNIASALGRNYFSGGAGGTGRAELRRRKQVREEYDRKEKEQNERDSK